MSTRTTLFWILAILVFPPNIFLFIIWWYLDLQDRKLQDRYMDDD